MSDLGFKGGTYALPTDSLIESSVKSAGAPAVNVTDAIFAVLGAKIGNLLGNLFGYRSRHIRKRIGNILDYGLV